MPGGAELRAQITVDRAAVDNWARLTGCMADTLITRREALLETIESDGALLDGPPAWMTSPKPGVDRWLALPGQVVLAIAEDPGQPRPLRAQNALAPRRGRTRAAAVAVTRGDQLTPADRAWALTAAQETILAACRASAHVVDRLAQRAGVELESPEAVMAWLATRKLSVAQVPVWADASGAGSVCLLVDGQIALALASDEQPGVLSRLVITSAMTFSWAQTDLQNAEVTVSRAVSRALWPDLDDGSARARVTSELTNRRLVRGGAIADLAGRQVMLRPVRGGWVARQIMS